MIAPILIIIGLLLRINTYLVNRSLWVDEAVRALNVLDKNIPDFLKDLEYGDTAPFGFLTSEKLTINLFGNSEYSLRLLPLLAGLASVFLFYQLCKKFLNPLALFFAVGLFSFSRPLIYYSSEVRQYSLDLAICLILFLLALKKSPSPKLTFFFLIFGSLSIWFSHPAIFIIASISIFKIFSSSKKSGLLIIFLWGISFLFNYLLSFHPLQTQVVNPVWQSTFATLNPSWYLKAFLDIFESPLDLFFPVLGTIFFLLGGAFFLSKDKKLFCLFTAPIFFALIASYFHLYPFFDRFLLFSVPVFFLFIAKGVEALFSPAKHRLVLGFAVALLILLTQAALSIQTVLSPNLIEETRPLITYWRANHQKNDIIYLYYSSGPSFRYYAPKDDTNAIFGIESRDNPDLYEKDLEKLKGYPSVWLLFSHVYNNEEEYIISYLNKTRGKPKFLHTPGASLYLYSPTP